MDAPVRAHVGRVSERAFRLEALRIDPETGEVAGPGGRQDLDPKVMGVLVHLAEHAGQVVSRDDLHQRLWPNAVVTDDALTRCIHELRRQLSLAGGDARYRTMIETLPKRGYRLKGAVAPLEPAPDPAPPRRASRAWLASGIAVAGALLALVLLAVLRRDADPPGPSAGEPISVAVLPFVDLSEAQDQSYFADGVAEEILNRLSRSGGLRVISRTSSFVFRGEGADVPEIAERLGVTHVLEGSVRRSGDTIRITAQLIAAADDAHVWSATYDRGVGELLAVQDEIAEAVADALRATLSLDGKRVTSPVSPAAYDRYLQGRLFHNRRGEGDPQRAVRAFEEAVALDPAFASAWAALAGAYMVMVDMGAMTWDEGRARQRAAAEEAIRLDPSNPEGYARLGQYYFAMGDLGTARTLHDKARSLGPVGNSRSAAWTGLMHLHEDLDAAIADARRALATDPLSAISHQNLGLVLFAAGQLEEARIAFTRASELSPGMELDAAGEIARVLIAERKFDEAHEAAMRLPDQRSRDPVLALLVESPGHRATADAALARLEGRDDPGEMHAIRLAEAYAVRGRKDEAFAALARFQDSLDADDPRRFARIWRFHQEVGIAPFLATLHSDPRWSASMAEARRAHAREADRSTG